MPADRSDLDRRLAECRDADTTRGLNFNRLFELVREHLGEDATRACDPEGKGSPTSDATPVASSPRGRRATAPP
jgi:hypothetical protein